MRDPACTDKPGYDGCVAFCAMGHAGWRLRGTGRADIQ